MAEHVAGAVNTRALAVPEAEHAVILAFAVQLRLLGAPNRRRRQILVDAGMKHDIPRLEEFFGAGELQVKPADRRAAVAGDIARRVQPGALVALMLHQHQPDDGLRAVQEDMVLGDVEFVVQQNLAQRKRLAHRILPKPDQYSATAGGRVAEYYDSFTAIINRLGQSRRAALEHRAINLTHIRRP